MRRMAILIAAGLVAALLPPARPVARAGLGDLLDSVRSRLDPVLLTYDLLVEPDQEVAIGASLRTGLRLEGIEGKRLQFYSGDLLLGEARTDADGRASLRWQVPEEPGDYTITVKIHPDDQGERRVEDSQLLVAARRKDAALVVVDLDKTLVASGFARVLVGGARPMDGADVVMTRLAKDHTIVYLTHRPDFLGPTSKAWLSQNRFPPGPVLTSSLTTLLAGSGKYKADRLESIKRTYANVKIGIGDKISDAQAYVQNGVRSILILQVDWTDDKAEHYEKLAAKVGGLPDTVDVVTNWSEIASVLFDGARFTKDAMVKRLREVASDLRRRGND